MSRIAVVGASRSEGPLRAQSESFLQNGEWPLCRLDLIKPLDNHCDLSKLRQSVEAQFIKHFYKLLNTQIVRNGTRKQCLLSFRR